MSKKLTDYKIVTDKNVHKLSEVVTIEIKLGWEPYGSPYSIVTETRDSLSQPYHFQAMVKYSTSDPD